MHLLLTYADILLPSEAVLQHAFVPLCFQVLGGSALRLALWTMRRPGNAQSAAQPGGGIWSGAMAAMTGGRPPPQLPPPAPPSAAAQPENLEVPALVLHSPHPMVCVKPSYSRVELSHIKDSAREGRLLPRQFAGATFLGRHAHGQHFLWTRCTLRTRTYAPSALMREHDLSTCTCRMCSGKLRWNS